MSYYVVLEYLVLFVLNIKFKYIEFELNGLIMFDESFSFGDFNYVVGIIVGMVSDLLYVDYIFYYEIFDNDLVFIDLGVNVKQFDGEIMVMGIL